MTEFRINRRGLIRTGAALGAGLAAPALLTRAAFAADYRNAPTGKTVKLGFNVPQTGPYADEGADELRAYQLAVKHLNGEGDGGMLQTFSSKALKGNGILGKKVEYVTGDTQTKTDAARASAKRMVESDGVVMITGGSSSGVAVGVQSYCQEAGVIFMAAITHANETTGKDKKANGFRHFFNAYMSAQALQPVLAEKYGKDRKAYYLSADYNWGWSVESSMSAAMEKAGWSTIAKVRSPLGTGDFSQYLTPILNSGADVLFLDQYGRDMVNSLTQAVQFGMKDKMVNGKKFEIVVPLYSELMAQGAGSAVKGVMGSANWDWKLDNAGTKAFVTSFGKEYGRPPSQAAQTAYAQTMLYADAAARAGSFNPCEVGKALEDFTFSGLGDEGQCLYRKADHQVFKPVLVVQGAETPKDEYHLVEVVKVVPTDQVKYAPDNPAFAGGDLGTCNAGA